MKNKHRGLVQIPLLIGLLLVAVALPMVAKLAQKPQDVRNRAAEPAVDGPTATPTCNPNQKCSLKFGCVKNDCANPGMNETNCVDCHRLPERDGIDNSFCNSCPVDVTNTPTPTPTATSTPTPVVFNCKPGDENTSVKAFRTDGTEVAFSTENGQLKIDSGFTENKVVFQVTISNKSNIKNVGLKFGSKAVAWAKLTGLVWTGSMGENSTGVNFYGDPTASGNLTVKFPLQISFEKDVPVDILVQYY